MMATAIQPIWNSYYIPLPVGFFLSPDPLEFAGGDPNLYRYCFNNPINCVDPFGLWSTATEYKTSLEGLKPQIAKIEKIVDQVFQSVAGRDAIITFSTNGVHSQNSLHYSGNAIDLRTRDLSPGQVDQVVKRLRKALGEDYDVVDERTHIHIEYDPKKKKVCG
ncbi:MAG: hypothetical protein OXB84_06190 [Halobacteriovoraceae bacterium]|nr:hypothetical protein [Halobacteriovoraceae bacterium]